MQQLIKFEIDFMKLLCFANCNHLIYNANDILE